MRVCADCHMDKIISEFYFNSTRGNYQSYCKPCFNKRVTAAARKRLYGINPEQFSIMLESQDFTCAICKCESNRWDIDHNDVTGEVRGILCPQCNKGLGLFKHNIEWLQNSADYLVRGHGAFRGER